MRRRCAGRPYRVYIYDFMSNAVVHIVNSGFVPFGSISIYIIILYMGIMLIL